MDFELSIAQKRAHKIMGKNFFGVEEASKHFGIVIFSSQTSDLADVPFSEATLQKHKDSHILVAVFPLSFRDVMRMRCGDIFPSGDILLRDHREIASKYASIGWHLVRKGAHPHTDRKSWEASLRMLEKDKERVPEAFVVAYTAIGHCLATGEKMFKDEKSWNLRCAEVLKESGHIVVGVSYDRRHYAGGDLKKLIHVPVQLSMGEIGDSYSNLRDCSLASEVISEV